MQRPRVLDLAVGGAGALPQLLQAAPRALALLDSAEALVVRFARLVEAIEQTRQRVALVTEGVDATLLMATGVVEQAALATARVNALLDGYEMSLTALAPAVARLAERSGPAQADALMDTVERTPALLDTVEKDLLPTLETLKTVAPDLTDLLDSSRTLNEMLGGLPGLGRIKKRLDEEAQDADETGESTG